MRQYNNQKIHNQAFTLIELVLFMGLFTVILGVLVNLFTVIIDTQMEVQSTSAVESDSKFITSRFIYDISRAQGISVPGALGAQTSSLTLDIDGTDYVYSLQNGNLQLTTGLNSDVLNTATNAVTSISFRRLGNIGGKNAIQLTFTISSRNPSAAGQETKHIDTMIGLR